jgi:hypothetical protein
MVFFYWILVMDKITFYFITKTTITIIELIVEQKLNMLLYSQIYHAYGNIRMHNSVTIITQQFYVGSK